MTRLFSRARAFAASALLLAATDSSARAASISLTITDSDGHPLADAVVSVTPVIKAAAGTTGPFATPAQARTASP